MRIPAAGVVVFVIAVTGGVAAAGELRIEFRGNHDISSDILRAAIHADSPDPVTAPDSPVVQRDLLLVSAYYWDHGYANAKLQTPVLDPAHDTIIVPVVEGPSFTIGQVLFGGELSPHAPSGEANVHARSGMTFSRTMIAEDRARLAAAYQDEGFAFATVVPLTRLDPAAKTISITYELTRGKRAKLERVDFRGNTKIASDILARDFAYEPGEIYDPRRIDAGKQQLLASGHARDVTISQQHGSDDTRVVLQIDITE